jgi:hypothetical protein
MLSERGENETPKWGDQPIGITVALHPGIASQPHALGHGPTCR